MSVSIELEKYKCVKSTDGKHQLEIIGGTSPIIKVVCLLCNDVFDIRKKPEVKK